jgi:hypothetical protein
VQGSEDLLQQLERLQQSVNTGGASQAIFEQSMSLRQVQTLPFLLVSTDPL